MQLHFALEDERIDFGEVFARVRSVGIGGFAGQQQGAGDFAFMVPELAAQQQPERVVGIDRERFLQRVLGFVQFAVGSQQLRLAAPRLRILCMFGDGLGHQAEGHLVLALPLLLEGPLDFTVDRFAAPLEFLAAAARA